MWEKMMYHQQSENRSRGLRWRIVVHRWAQLRSYIWSLFTSSADSPFHFEHVAWDSYQEIRSSGPSSQHNSHPSCTGSDLEWEEKHDIYSVTKIFGATLAGRFCLFVSSYFQPNFSLLLVFIPSTIIYISSSVFCQGSYLNVFVTLKQEVQKFDNWSPGILVILGISENLHARICL